MVTAASLSASTLSTTVTADTYLRNDGGTNSTTTWNSDTDNEFLVGSNGSNDNLRGLIRFSVADITNAVAGTGGGNYANLTINSVTLTLNERRGFARTGMNMTVHSYGSQFVESAATWVDPDGNGNTATGDTTAGGTPGASLGTGSLTWNATADSESLAITLDPSAFKTAIQGAPTVGDINMLIRSTVAFTNFVSIKSNLTAGRLATLVVDYTVTPASGPLLTVDPATPQPDFTFPFSSTAVSPLTRTLRYKNTGDSGTITISAINVTGAAFTLGTVSPALPATLAVGQTIDIPILASSATGGSFTGSVFINTDVDPQDKTLPLSASFYQSGSIYNSNSSMSLDLSTWGGSSTFVTPGFIAAGDGMARVHGAGDPVQPVVKSSLSQATAIPNNLPDWALDFRFSPVAPSVFADYAGQPADGQFGDRTFQMVIQSNDTSVPAPNLTATFDDSTLINIAYFPDGITTGGTAGFYLYNGVTDTWQLVDFNGDGSALVLAGSTDVDADANPANGVGDGILDAASGDTVNAYRMTIRGSNFGSGSASYSITVNGPGAGFPKTVSGLTISHNQAITAALPASFAFITSDQSPESNPTSGFAPSFWVDEVGYFAIARPAQRLLLFNPPTLLRSINGSSPAHVLSLFNDGVSVGVDLSASLSGTSSVTLQSPPVFPTTLAPGTLASFTLGLNPTLLTAPNTAAAGTLVLTSNDPATPTSSYNFTAAKVTDDNLAANGDFQSDSTGTAFPVAWNTAGTVANNSGAAALAASSSVWQDFSGPAVTTTNMNNFQMDYQFSVDAFNLNGSRFRLRGANNAGNEDVLAIRFDSSGLQTADSRSGSIVWQTALATPLSINTNYHIRIIGENFDNVATRRYKFGISNDGVTYAYGAWLTATHTYNATNVWDVETLTFESGSGVNMLVDNVVVKLLPPTTFASWISGYAFAPGADTTATGDADGDGVSNLVENVLGTAPNAPTSGLTQIGGTGTSVTFKHTLNAALASDVTYTYQWSTDLNEWKSSGQPNTGGTTTTITAGAPVSGEVTVTASVTAGTASKLFVRLVATQTP